MKFSSSNEGVQNVAEW